MQNSTFETGLSYGPPSTKYASSNINPIQSEKEIYSPSKLNSCSPVHKISVVNIDNEKTKEAKQLSNAKRNDLNNQNDLIRHNNQNNSWKSNDAARPRER